MARVLVVDDNDIDRTLVRRMLGSEYSLSESATASHALELLGQTPPDCVLLDHRLPDRNGLDIIADFANRLVPVVMLTGHGDERTVVRALKAGARDYLVKDGLTAEILVRAIRNAIREAKLLHEKRALLEERDALSATQEEFEALLKSTTDYVSIVAGNGQIKYVNPACAKLLGWTEINPVGRLVSEMHTKKESDRLVEKLVPHALRHGSWSGEIVLRAASGQLIPTDSVVVAKADENGSLLFIATVSRDMRERAKLEAQLRQAQKMEAMGRLAGGVAHDFNNVLTAIFSFSNFAAESIEKGHPAQDDLEEVQRAARRAKDLTQQLLSFSRKRTVEPVVINPNERIRSSKRMLSRLLGENIQIEFRAQAVGTVRIDAGALEQVLVNLAVNARDAMPSGGKLTLETKDTEIGEDDERCKEALVLPGSYLTICVNDTGIGMDEETRHHIFEPFFTTKPTDKGTGLGLATVYGIVKQAGGYISVSSEQGVGTSFEILLPRISARPRATSIEQRSQQSGGTERILLVEDDDQIRRLAQRSLKREGYQVVAAENGERALELASQDKGSFHLLITDVVMPGLTGKQVAEALRQTRPDIKVLYISGYTQDIIADHGIVEEGISLLQKPFSPAGLTDCVRRVLDNGERS